MSETPSKSEAYHANGANERPRLLAEVSDGSITLQVTEVIGLVVYSRLPPFPRENTYRRRGISAATEAFLRDAIVPSRSTVIADRAKFPAPLPVVIGREAIFIACPRAVVAVVRTARHNSPV